MKTLLFFCLLALLSCEKEPESNTIFFASAGGGRDYAITGEFGTFVVRENANQFPRCGDFDTEDFVITYIEPGIYHVTIKTEWSQSNVRTIEVFEDGCNVFDASHWGGW
jgi:hypothetical protein